MVLPLIWCFILRVKVIVLISEEHDVVAMGSEPGVDGQPLIRFRYSVAVIQILIIATLRWLAMWLANDGSVHGFEQEDRDGDLCGEIEEVAEI
jgi:hypothetical protein